MHEWVFCPAVQQGHNQCSLTVSSFSPLDALKVCVCLWMVVCLFMCPFVPWTLQGVTPPWPSDCCDWLQPSHSTLLLNLGQSWATVYFGIQKNKDKFKLCLITATNMQYHLSTTGWAAALFTQRRALLMICTSVMNYTGFGLHYSMSCISMPRLQVAISSFLSLGGRPRNCQNTQYLQAREHKRRRRKERAQNKLPKKCIQNKFGVKLFDSCDSLMWK